MDSPRFSALIRYWWAFLAIATLGFFSEFVEPYLGYRTIGFIFLMGVLAVGSLSSLGPVLFSATLSALIWNFFFIPPRFTFAISQPEDVILCLCYFVAAVITGSLTAEAKRQETLATERETRTQFLYEILQDILQCSEPQEFLERISMRIENLLGGRLRFLMDEEEKLEDSSARVVFPIRGRGKPLGQMVFEQSTPPLSPEQSALLDSVAQQIGMAIERLNMEKRLRATARLEESERLHQTLLNSISHELRTPLTALVGFASALNDGSQSDLAAGLTQACDRLNRVIGNLLDMSRLNSGGIGLHKEWHDVSDLLGVALKGLEGNLKGHNVLVKVEDGLPLLEMDFRLMEHAIANVILNAATYAPIGSTIEIAATKKNDEISITIQDEGPGIPEESTTKIFEKFYRVPGTPPGGTGLGLSIVKSIVEFHQGEVTAGPSMKAQGARLSIDLPLGRAPQLPVEVNYE